ncbi:hypothetical protein EJB05_05341, partial [Eragrostis curvula]
MAVSHDISSCVLLHVWADVADSSRNATTASSATSEGEPIWVSFRGADPPALSTLAVHIPDRKPSADVRMMPKLLSVARRPLPPPRGRHTELRRRRRLRCSGSDEQTRLGAEIQPSHVPLHRRFAAGKLDLAGDVGGGAAAGHVVPRPRLGALAGVPYITTKVIVLGGDQGTIGWVDLWRGIILCDVLSEKPELRDMPLPSPTRGGRISFRNSDPYFFRDINVDKLRNTIKYVDMVMRPRELPFTPSCFSCAEPENEVVLGDWKATTYTMPIPVTSWNDWRRGCFIRSDDLELPVDNPEYCNLLRDKLMISSSDSKEQEATEEVTCLSPESMQMAHPALSTGDDDIVYMLAMGPSMEKGIKLMVAVDAKAGTLQAVANTDAIRYLDFLTRDYVTSWIPKHLKATGTSASSQHKEHELKLENM